MARAVARAVARSSATARGTSAAEATDVALPWPIRVFRSRRFAARWWLACAIVLVAALAGCGQSLPGGTYTSSTYHFRVSYPTGWEASSSTGDAIIPLTVTFTRSASHVDGAPSVSALTISVQSLSNPYIAKAANGLVNDSTLHTTTISGLPAFTSGPRQQALPGAQGTPALWIPGPNGTPTPHDLPAGTPTPSYNAGTVTHTDYFLVHGGYEYQLSTDAMSSDGVDTDLRTMVQSFTLIP
ncbi:MAG TPA: hypothetical protein VIC85_16880 [Ktedonobacterales bacterium]